MSDPPRRVDDPSELAELFGRDRANHIYALADLDEPYWSASTWWRRSDAAVGLVGLPGGETIVYAVSSADPVGTLRLLREVNQAVPATLVTGPTGLASTLEDAGRTLEWHRGYHRFVLRDRGAVAAPAGRAQQQVVALESHDAPRLAALYAHQPGAAFFLPSMLEDHTFVGVRSGGELIAAAGTHVMSERFDVAAIGAVFVHPDHRGRRLGAAVTAGVIDRIGSRVGTIGLNCADHNTAARRIYLHMGFRETLGYEECELAG